MTKFKLWTILVLGFWYLALFPGRLGFDNARLLELIKDNKSTDWWTGGYFWFIKLLSFNGNSIWLVSLVSLLSGAYSVYRFIELVNLDQRTNKKIFIVFCGFPLAPVFFLTISHDAFQCSGLLLVVANLGFIRERRHAFAKTRLAEICLGCTFLTFTFSGQIVALFSTILFFILSKEYKFLLAPPLVVLLITISGLGVTNEISSAKFTWPMIADLKCVIQHPNSKVTDENLVGLIELAPLKTWKKPVSCKRMDESVALIDVRALERVDKIKLTQNYISIVAQNPQIVLMAHIQKNLGLLPPPFFQPPKNMTSWNVDEPVGKDSDSSLQSAGEVLHSSIDLDRIKHNSNLIKPFEAIALFPVFLINQASWFWGWAGLWSYFSVYLVFRNRQRLGVAYAFPPSLLAVVLLVVAPESATRYAMFFTLAGTISLTIILGNKLKQQT